MFCQYQYYRKWDSKKLQTAVAHSDEKYQCKEMSDCPYTGTTVMEKIPWGDCPAGEIKETAAPTTRARQQEESEPENLG